MMIPEHLSLLTVKLLRLVTEEPGPEAAWPRAWAIIAGPPRLGTTVCRGSEPEEEPDSEEEAEEEEELPSSEEGGGQAGRQLSEAAG
eukprot:3525186-Rhodomonas_salina.3